MRAIVRGLTLLLVYLAVVSPALAATRVTTDVIEATFGRQNTVSRGRILFMSDHDVYLHDGITSTLLQEKGTLGDLANNVFSLGSGSTASSVIGGWRRGTDFAWVSVDGGTPLEVSYTNPFDAENAMNPEEVAIADGCIFFGFQAATLDVDGDAFLVQTVARVDPSTGVATNITGNSAVYGRFSRISTSQCKAVWLWWSEENANENPDDDPIDVHYYSVGSGLLTTIDSAVGIGSPVIANGRIFYRKAGSNGVAQVFMYDTTATFPASVQITSYAEGSIGSIVTDGRFVVWTRQTPAGNARHLVFYPGVRLTTPSNRPSAVDLQMHRGHLFWTSDSGAYWVNSESGSTAVSTAPSTDPRTPKLSDGVLAWTGLADDGLTDREIYQHDIGTPSAAPPPRLVRATPTLGNSIVVSFAQIVGASHNVYMASTSGVTRSNYASLAGGRKFSNVTNPFTSPVLSSGTYHFVVTAVENGVEGTESTEVSASIHQGQWVPGVGMWDFEMWDVKADRQNGAILYASAARSGLWKSTDGGTHWNGPLSIDRPGNDITLDLDIRAAAADGPTVVAVSKDGDIYRSSDSGLTWTQVFDGDDIGESQKVVMIDPGNPSVYYAADTNAAGATTVSNYIVKSTDAGLTWSQLPNSDAGEIRAYALAADPDVPNRLVAAGTGAPVVVSEDGGSTWVRREPAAGLYQTTTVAGGSPSATYVSGTTFSNGDFDGLGVYRSVDGGLNWTQRNGGLPSPYPRIYTIYADPMAPASLHAGTVSGYYKSDDAGANWVPGTAAGATPSSSLDGVRAFAATSIRRLAAANWNGLFLSTLLPPPSISSVSPTSGTTSGGTSVTITGSGFLAVTGTQVTFGGVAATVDLGISNSTSLRVTTPPHAAGAVDVQVTNADGQAALAAGAFNYSSTTPPPGPAGGHARNDFNGDGRSDVLWRNMSSGANAAYLMNGSSIASAGLVNFEIDFNYKIAGTGDFNGDGRFDVFWRNEVNGANVIYLMNGLTISSIQLVNFEVDPNYKIVGTGDFDGDGNADVLWRNFANGANVIYFMNGASVSAISLVNFEVDMNYKVVGTGDYDGDGKTDIFWRNEVNGANVTYHMNGATISSINLVNFEVDPNYKIKGMGDFNGDGRSDVFWRNEVNGANVTYHMNGATISSINLVNFEVDADYKIVGLGDYNADNRTDVWWRNLSSGANVTYHMNGASIAAINLINFEPDMNWKFIP